MSWVCLNCETVNFDAADRCIVCNDERYFKMSQVRQMIAENPETQEIKEEIKKVTKHIKWLQTRNKNLAQENKVLKEEKEAALAQLSQKDSTLQRFEITERDIQQAEEMKGSLQEVETLKIQAERAAQLQKQAQQWRTTSAILLVTSVLLGLALAFK